MSTSEEPAEPVPPTDVLRFEQLRVTRFNGIEHGLEVNLCEGVNVVYGSNASGKTTLARAIRALLWPDHVGDQHPIVEARFNLDGSTWRAELEGERCGYTKDQTPASAPALPPASHGPRYHLYLHDLLGKEEGEEAFARRVLQEAQGGIDVEGAAEELGFEIPSRRTAQITETVEQLRQKRDATRDEQEALRRQEQRLEELREKRAGAQRAARRASALRQAQEVAAARRAHDEAEAALKAFPDLMEEVRGDEAERLESLQEELETANGQIQEAEAQIRETEETIEESRVPEQGLAEGRVEKLRTLVSTIREQERAVRERRAEIEEAEQTEERTWERLPTGTDKDAAADIDLPELEEVERHVRAAQDLQGRQESFETAEKLFADASPDTPVETLRDGLKHLHRWLQLSGAEAPSESGMLRWAVLIAGLLVAGSGALLVLLGSGSMRGVGVVLVALGALIAAAEWNRRARTKDEESGRRALHEAEYERLGLDGPSDWSRDAVGELADALLDRLREAQVAVEKRQTWDRLQSEYEGIEARAEALEQERQRLAGEIGFDPDVGSHSLSMLLDRLSRWQAAHDELEAKRLALDTARDEAEKCRARLNEALEEYELGPVEDGSEAKRAVATLDTARNEFREAKRDLEQGRGQKESAIQRRDEAQEEIRNLYDRLDLEQGADGDLRELVGQHEAYRQAVEDARRAEATLEAELRHLRREEAYEEHMEEATTEELDRKRTAAEKKAEKKEQLVEQIKTIERDVQAAREEGTLEQRQAEYRERRSALAEEREADYRKAVGSVLANFVQEETRDQGLPPVFYRARELFAEITDYRYELTLHRGRPSFRAFDRTREKSFALDELSSGTQVQLVLSVRIAFLETQEQACRAPLVLDETLANSDGERARAIIEAVKTICAEGRQVLYLTAQADEVQKWRASLGEEEMGHSVVSLGELSVRDLSGPGGDGAAVPVRRAPEDLPDPDATTHEELRAVVGVPDWSPRQPVGRLHLWYLVESPTSLTELLESGTSVWGQLQNRHQLGGVGATPFGEKEFRRVQARAQAVGAWKEAWHVGRGRPVDRKALKETDAVTDTFIDGVTEIAKELDGDAGALLEVIRERSDERVEGFYSSKADDLEAYFLEHGYLVRQDPLAPGEMWQRVLADLAEERVDGVVSDEELERLFDRLRPDVG